MLAAPAPLELSMTAASARQSVLTNALPSLALFGMENHAYAIQDTL
jgi:hypothetical protein